MRARAVLGSTLASVGILALGWQIGSPALTASGVSQSATADGTTTTTAGSGASSTTNAANATSSASTVETFVGSSVSTRFGPVQVQITVSDGTITDVTALQLTDADRRSVQISNRAAPLLAEEVLAAQSAQVSNIGGATYTTNAYLQSLQSALDQAGL